LRELYFFNLKLGRHKNFALSGDFSFVLFIYPQIMFVPSTQTIILAIIGMLGLFSTAIVMSYSFKRNKTGSGKYQ